MREDAGPADSPSQCWSNVGSGGRVPTLCFSVHQMCFSSESIWNDQMYKKQGEITHNPTNPETVIITWSIFSPAFLHTSFCYLVPPCCVCPKGV